MSGGGAEVGIHGGVGSAVSGDDNGIGEPDAETGGDGGVGYVGQVICIYRYVPLNDDPTVISLRTEGLPPLRNPFGIVRDALYSYSFRAIGFMLTIRHAKKITN